MVWQKRKQGTGRNLGLRSSARVELRCKQGGSRDRHLKLKPELEAGLTAQAQASGMTVEEFLLAVAEPSVLPALQTALSPEERAAAFEEWSAGHRATPPLSDKAVSRDSMYEGREH